MILFGFWAVWSERNARHHGDDGRTVGALVKGTIDTLMDLARLGKDLKPSHAWQWSSWRPPDENFLKINVDASFVVHSGQGGMELVVCDHAGTLVQAQALWYDYAANPGVM